MAHFARLDKTSTVIDVVVVSNDVALDEVVGIVFLIEQSGHENWVQCSYNGTIRKQYPGRGYLFDAVADIFISPQPFPSWTLDAAYDWQAPVPMPQDGTQYFWEEAMLEWVASNAAESPGR